MHCKSYSHFFSKKFQNICVSLEVNFNESLTNDIVSFEQLGPGLYMLGKTFRQHFEIFFLLLLIFFHQKKENVTFFAKYPKDITSMKHQTLFSGKNKKISICHLLKYQLTFLPALQRQKFMSLNTTHFPQLLAY